MPVLPGEDDQIKSNPDVTGSNNRNRKSSSAETSNYYSSLPRSMGHRTLPSLPEAGTLSTPSATSGLAGSGQPLVRSVSYNPDRQQNSSMHNQSSSTHNKSPLISDLMIAADHDIKKPNKLDVW